MGSTFGKSLGYDISDEYRQIANGWELHEGTSTENNEEVSIFLFKKSQHSRNGIATRTSTYLTYRAVKAAENCYKRARTIKHPNFLNVLHFQDSPDVLCLVTERVKPLEDMIRQNTVNDKNGIALVWGLRQVGEAITFLHENVRLSHSNLSTSSIFVNRSLFWKLGALDFSQEARAGTILDKDVNSYCDLIEHVFSLSRTSLPESLRRITSKGSQNGIGGIIKSSIFDTREIKVLQFSNSMEVKTEEEREVFLSNLDDVWKVIPKLVAMLQVAPKVFYAIEMGLAKGSIHNLLSLCLDVSEDVVLNEDVRVTFTKYILKLLSSNERQIRISMLKLLPSYKSVLQSESMISAFKLLKNGLLDVDTMSRDAHLKAMVHFIPHLEKQSLREVIDAVYRLREDKSSRIRTNATILMGTTLKHISDLVKEPDITAFFKHSLMDPFPQARLSALNAISSNKEYFGIESISLYLLPIISTMLVDKDSSIRNKSLKLVKSLLPTIELMQQKIVDGESEGDQSVNSKIRGYLGSYSFGKSSGKKSAEQKVEKNVEEKKGKSLDNILGHDEVFQDAKIDKDHSIASSTRKVEAPRRFVDTSEDLEEKTYVRKEINTESAFSHESVEDSEGGSENEVENQTAVRLSDESVIKNESSEAWGW